MSSQTTRPKGKQGFASMSPERRRAIASLGGKKGHALGIAHQWTPEEAAAAGRKGGQVSAARRLARQVAARIFAAAVEQG